MRLRKLRITLFISGLALLLFPAPGKSQGSISTFTGNGVAGFSGDGDLATSASLNHPSGLAVESGGAIYIADSDNHRIRRVSGGMISTVAGNGSSGSFGDGGPATDAAFADISAVAVDLAGNLYIADSGNHRVRKVGADGIVTAFAGTGVQGTSGDGGLAVDALLNRPIGLALDYAGNLYICDSANHNIRIVNLASGMITTYAGNGVAAFSGDNGPATDASFQFPLGIATDNFGNLFIADAGNNRIRKIDSTGMLLSIAGDGSGPDLNIPAGVTVDSAGNVFFSDAGHNQVRMIDPSGAITTVAGGNNDGFSGDGGSPLDALLSFPWGIVIDSGANLYVADRANHRIRTISGIAAGGLPLSPPPTSRAAMPQLAPLSSAPPR